MKKGVLLMCLVFAGFVLTMARPAHAGSYLDRSTMIVEGARRDATSLRAHLTDKELALVVLAVARARYDAAEKMDVPPLVAKAHPHLLLFLAHIEKAADAATSGNYKNAVLELDGARVEESLFRGMLKETGYPLPAAPKAHAGLKLVAPRLATP